MTVYIAPFFACALLALAYQYRTGANRLYGFTLLTLAVFAGIRWEVGPLDWPAYAEFFDNIVLHHVAGDGISNISSTPADSRFEVGYFWLNYAIKYIGGTYAWVQLLASLFCAFAVYRLTSRYAINRFYVLTVYVSYSFLILHFAQVRQSIAIAFFLLAVDSYLRRPRAMRALLICSAGMLFQYSGVIYLFLFAAVLVWPKFQRLSIWTRTSLIIAGVPVLFVMVRVVDPYTLIASVATASAVDKIEVYRETQTTQGVGLLFYALYLCVLIAYLRKYIEHVPPVLARFALFSLAFTVAMVLLFPGSYVMYSRAYVVACVFQGLAVAFVLARERGLIHRGVFAASILIGAVYYYRIISLYADEYVPYRTIFE